MYAGAALTAEGPFFKADQSVIPMAAPGSFLGRANASEGCFGGSSSFVEAFAAPMSAGAA